MCRRHEFTRSSEAKAAGLVTCKRGALAVGRAFLLQKQQAGVTQITIIFGYAAIDPACAALAGRVSAARPVGRFRHSPAC